MSAPGSVLPAEEIIYPESDGKPLGENTLHWNTIVFIKEGFEVLYMGDADVFVAGDLFWYPVQGQRTTVTAPDTLIAFGRPKGRRGSYRQWHENHVAPQVIWEVLSPNTTETVIQELFEFYQRYGVEEYYEYDPDNGRLRGWIRQGAVLVVIAAIQGWVSPRTGVRMEVIVGQLRLTYPDGQPFRTLQEERRLRQQESHRADDEKQRADELKQRADELKQRAEDEKQRADDEKQRTDELKQRTDELKQRADELKQLTDELKQLTDELKLRADDEKQRAEDEKQRADELKQRAEDEKQRAEKLAARLRELGLNPDE